MKTINKLSFLLGICFFLCLSACHDEEHYAEEIKDGRLVLSYEVDGGMQASTYALAAETHECRIDDVYTLFFRASSHATNPNAYVGFTRTGLTASTPTGSARVTLPAGEDVNDEWQLIFLANLDANAFLDGELNVDNLLANKVATKTYSDAREYLMGFFDLDTGMGAPLAMATSFTKPDSTNVASITLKRRVARIDVSNSAGNFVFETVQVWNARTRGYLLDEGGSFVSGTSANEFCHYDAQVVNAAAGVAQAKLYAYPNFVVAPTIRDNETTCLIVGGKYNGSSTTTYYRINVCPASGQQALKANGAYTVNIKNVTAAGETDPGDAYDKSQLNVDYTLNEWDDSFLGTYVFDEHGNGLAVSQRTVVYSDKGNQSVELEVFTITSATNPISGSWTVGTPQGVDAASFSSQKVPAPANRYLRVTALNNNETTTDRTAVVNVNWGTINLPISLTQLNPTSYMGGIKLQPSQLWFMMTGDTKEICVNLQGNFSGVTRSDITTSVIYPGSDTGWLTLGAGTTSDDLAAGLIYFNVTAAGNGTLLTRLADIKFVVKQGTMIATAQASVTQSTTAPTDPLIRQLTMRLLEKTGSTYTDKGLVSQIFPMFKGLPTGQSTANDLHFSLISHDYLKYKMVIHSSQAWKIVPTGYAATGIRFSQMSDPGDKNVAKEVTISAANDEVTGWDGAFYLEYEDGVQVHFSVHQQGVFASLAAHSGGADGSIYYYGTFLMNGKLWLDRNIGATVGQDGINGYYSNQGSTGITSNPAAKGVYLSRAQANTACPPGFRLPKRTANSGEWDWVFNEMKWSTANGDLSSGGVSYKNVWYVTLSDSPKVRWFLPVCGHSGNSLNTYGNYWSQEVGYLYFNSNTGAKNLNTSDTANSLSVRCVQGS